MSKMRDGFTCVQAKQIEKEKSHSRSNEKKRKTGSPACVGDASSAMYFVKSFSSFIFLFFFLVHPQVLLKCKNEEAHYVILMWHGDRSCKMNKEGTFEK